MKKAKEAVESKCPKCGEQGSQMKSGYTECGTQRYVCGHCKCKYTLNPKSRAYPKETQELALKIYYSGVSGRGVGKILKMHHANVYNWIKKNNGGVDKPED